MVFGTHFRLLGVVLALTSVQVENGWWKPCAKLLGMEKESKRAHKKNLFLESSWPGGLFSTCGMVFVPYVQNRSTFLMTYYNRLALKCNFEQSEKKIWEIRPTVSSNIGYRSKWLMTCYSKLALKSKNRPRETKKKHFCQKKTTICQKIFQWRLQFIRQLLRNQKVVYGVKKRETILTYFDL